MFNKYNGNNQGHIDDPYPRNISAQRLSDMRKEYPIFQHLSEATFKTPGNTHSYGDTSPYPRNISEKRLSDIRKAFPSVQNGMK